MPDRGQYLCEVAKLLGPEECVRPLKDLITVQQAAFARARPRYPSSFTTRSSEECPDKYWEEEDAAFYSSSAHRQLSDHEKIRSRELRGARKSFVRVGYRLKVLQNTRRFCEAQLVNK